MNQPDNTQKEMSFENHACWAARDVNGKCMICTQEIAALRAKVEKAEMLIALADDATSSLTISEGYIATAKFNDALEKYRLSNEGSLPPAQKSDNSPSSESPKSMGVPLEIVNEMITTLNCIANMDYRGNRSQESQLAFKTMSIYRQWKASVGE